MQKLSLCSSHSWLNKTDTSWNYFVPCPLFLQSRCHSVLLPCYLVDTNFFIWVRKTFQKSFCLFGCFCWVSVCVCVCVGGGGGDWGSLLGLFGVFLGGRGGAFFLAFLFCLLTSIPLSISFLFLLPSCQPTCLLGVLLVRGPRGTADTEIGPSILWSSHTSD